MRNPVFCFLAAMAWTTLLFPFACLAMLVTLKPSTSIWIARRLWSPLLLRVGGGRLVVHGQQHVDPRRPTIYLSNHQSTIDIPALLMAIPANLRFVAKHQLRWVPVLGWYLWLAGHVFINRSNHRKALSSLEEAGRQIREGTSIIMFPEGTRSTDLRILPFKKGPFVLAVQAGVPVCPVTIEGSGRLMPKNSWKVTSGEIHVMIGEPIDTRAYRERGKEALMRQVREAIIRQSQLMGGRGGELESVAAPRGMQGVAPQEQHPS